MKVSEILKNAHAILITASNGLSIADGYHIFAGNSWFFENFSDFHGKYGISSPLEGIYYSYPSENERWAFFTRLTNLVHYSYSPSEMMKALYSLVKDTPHFILTSNGEDHFTPSGFKGEVIYEIEGSLPYFSCSNNCTDAVYSNRDAIAKMTPYENLTSIPDEALPRCKNCGSIMRPYLIGNSNFTFTKRWQRQNLAFNNFVNTYRDKNLVVLEFGIGYRNQLIKAPIMRLVSENPSMRYITINRGEIYIPKEIEDRSIGIDGDLKEEILNLVY